MIGSVIGSVYLLQFIVFLDLLGIGMVVSLLSNHARGLGASYIEVALLGSFYSAFQMISGPFIGSLSDLKGRKIILIMTLLISSVCYTLNGFITAVYGLLTLRVILGVFKHTQMLTRAMVSEYVRSERQSEIFGKMAATSGLGITFGPTISGHILEAYPERGFTYISEIVGLCFLINAGLVYMLPNPGPSRRKNSKKKSTKDIRHQTMVDVIWDSCKQSVLQLVHIDWYTYWDAFLLKGLVAFAMSIFFSNYTGYLRTVYNLTPKYTGYVISFQGSIASLVSFFIGSINKFYPNDEDYSVRNFHVFVLLSIALTGLILSHNIYLYTFWLIPLALGNAVGRQSSLEMILQRSGGHHRGSLIGASNSVRSIAGVSAPIVSGFISQYIGVEYPVYASLLATSLGITLSYYIQSKSNEDSEYKSDDGCEGDYEYSSNFKKTKND